MSLSLEPARNAKGNLKDASEITWYHDADSEIPISKSTLDLDLPKQSNESISRESKKRTFGEISVVDDSEEDSDEEPKTNCKQIRAHLVVVPSPSKSQSGKMIGNPGSLLLQKVVIKYFDPVTKKKYFTCAAEKKGCQFFRSGNAQKNRVFRHVKFCRYLEPGLKKAVNDESAAMSLGARTEASKQKPEIVEAQSTPLKPITTGLQPLSQLEAEAKRKGYAQLQLDVNHTVLKLICVAGIVPTILDLPEWQDFMALTCPRYKHTPSSKFVDDFIPAEASLIRQKTLETLKMNDNLTLSFDGMTTKRGDSVYTVHVTTKDRVSYLVDGFDGTGESHSGPWVTDKILKTINSIGVPHFSAMCSDSTGNTKSGRKDAHLTMPTIMDLGDCCHHLHNTIKDITALSEFKAPILLLKALIKFFNKSTIGKAALRNKRLDAGIMQGLTSIGKCYD